MRKFVLMELVHDDCTSSNDASLQFPYFLSTFSSKSAEIKIRGPAKIFFFFFRILTSSFLSSLDLSLRTLLALYIYSSFLVNDFKM